MMFLPPYGLYVSHTAGFRLLTGRQMAHTELSYKIEAHRLHHNGEDP